MAPRLELKTPDIEKILRNSRESLNAVIGGTDPALAAAEQLASAHRELVRSPGTGRIYDVEFRMLTVGGQLRPVPVGPARPPHRASAPGEPPATDLGNLIGSIGTEILGPGRVGEGVTKVGFYWKFLEFGTRFIDPRPFVRLGFALAKVGMVAIFVKKQRDRAKEIIANRRIGRGA